MGVLEDELQRLAEALVLVVSAYSECTVPTAVSDHMAPWIAIATALIEEVGAPDR